MLNNRTHGEFCVLLEGVFMSTVSTTSLELGNLSNDQLNQQVTKMLKEMQESQLGNALTWAEIKDWFHNIPKYASSVVAALKLVERFKIISGFEFVLDFKAVGLEWTVTFESGDKIASSSSAGLPARAISEAAVKFWALLKA